MVKDMNNKIKTSIYVLLFIIFIGGSTLAYNYFKEDNMRLPNLSSNQTEIIAEINKETDIVEETQTAEEILLAPDFMIQDFDGNEVSFLDYVGKPIVLNFWASWCPPCKKEMPDFEEVFLEMGDDITFMMVDMVDRKGGRETVEVGKSFIEHQEFTFPVYFDVNQEAALTYGVYSLPTTIFINSKGEIVTGVQGAIDKEMLLQGIGMIRDNVIVE